MSDSARQIFFLAVVTIFVTVITVVLFYGSGYSINWRSGDITTTSGLSIVTLPKTASITLQPGNITKTSPARFTQLEPDQYSVVISADGYSSQTLAINLTPQSAIQFAPVQLWPVTPTITTMSATPTEVVALLTTRFNNETATIHKNPKTGQWLLQQDNSLHIYDTAAETTKTLVRLAESITAATWHPNGWYALYSTSTELHIIDTRIDYTNSDTVIAQVGFVTALRCADNGRSCSYDSAGQTYTIALR